MIDWLKKNKKKIIVSIILLIIFIFGLNYYLNNSQSNNFVIHEVDYQDLTYYLSETGVVKQGTDISISFNQLGRINQLLAKEGQNIESGQLLIALDDQSLTIEKQRAQESLKLAQADYQRLLAGSSSAELNYYQVALDNTITALDNAEALLADSIKEKQGLERQIKADQDKIYSEALRALSESVDAGLNSLVFISDIQKDYFPLGTQESLRLGDAKGLAVLQLLGVENANYWSSSALVREFGGVRGLVAEANMDSEINLILQQTIKAVSSVKQALDIISINKLTSADLTLVSTEKGLINKALTALNTQEQLIANHEIASENKIEAAERAVQAAQRQVNAAQGSYQLAKAQLELKEASPRSEDEALYLARIRQAETEIRLIDQRIQETQLKAPFAGRVVEVIKWPGEITQPGQPVLKLRPKTSFQIEVDLYEGDIAQVEVGQAVEVELVAFPNQIISGKIIFINPNDKLINNVVYYPILIELEESLVALKAGLTADVNIILEAKENVLTVPESAIKRDLNKNIVRVLEADGVIQEREVELGMKGAGFQIEILSGLAAGEKIIAR